MSVDELEKIFKLIDLSPPDWPVSVAAALALPDIRAAIPAFPGAALAMSGRHASGRGIDAVVARRSAVAEAVEIASLCEWGDERLFHGACAELPFSYQPLQACLGFSKDQQRAQKRDTLPAASIETVPDLPGDDTALSWMPAVDPVRQLQVFVPADVVLLGRETPDVAALADTNGCAAAETASEARLGAVLELIERDATGRWWYGSRQRQLLDPRSLTAPGASCADWARENGRILRLFDITTDLEIPVVAAMIARKDGREVALGFSARLTLAEAAVKALAEAFQMHLLASAGNADAPHIAPWFEQVTSATPPLDPGGGLKPIPFLPPRRDAEAAFAHCMAACIRNEVEVLFLDRTRKELGVPVWQALASDLCHWKPRFGRRRLLAPDERDLSEPQLNPVLLRV
ncbi:YcaO-like family protein [Phaeobacter gallaeciensis]|uniref:YcaO-like family protein n=1 Tax=Phaeobacter gallaeciensis TaxID=60890 RepID=UPI00237FAA8C|nr:YcaO-like family protein [Phaeobacter gallaeciensis]MDE4100064.1 YcaO-like family protein [Phaeobacter gallaeciensis]MDE4108895.1 YcaO-like family protein [Phaeobacter gallaeciensis]MDE4113341.1 YcaO-like family protein [Phaeobacter gallaeciensis]MDE4117755.1 YcaO-like family protein [Phaeobacter gallaeciensis]MDE4122258.1 YcaO-like family protein [Phaeobacter gallaeciensis]